MILHTLALFIACIALGTANQVILEPELNAVVPAGSPNTCPPGYSQPVNSNWDKCYKVYTSYKTRKDASAYCKRDNGTLASAPDSFVNSYLYSLATQSSVTSMWLGTECFGNDASTCINDDGISNNYNNFNQGQPTSEDICVYMSTIGRDSQKWSTFDCEQAFPFACEVAFTNTLLNCPANYTAFRGTCYKILFNSFQVSKIGLRINAVKYQAATLHPYLPKRSAIYDFEKQVNDFLTTLPSDCPTDYYTLIGLHCTNVQFNGDIKSCTWSDGTPFTYSNFLTGEPQMYSEENCVNLRSGLWDNDFRCDHFVSCGACQAPMS